MAANSGMQPRSYWWKARTVITAKKETHKNTSPNVKKGNHRRGTRRDAYYVDFWTMSATEPRLFLPRFLPCNTIYFS